jgi:VanZ family protein
MNSFLKTILLVCVIATPLAIGSEILQSFYPQKTALINWMAGVIAGALVERHRPKDGEEIKPVKPTQEKVQ